jgi:hypothetical protein
MELPFDAQEFVEKLTAGEFDGRLHDEFQKLHYRQLEQVAFLMAQRLRQSTGEA